jgi:F0F1-type ATP synthase assembly protein I
MATTIINPAPATNSSNDSWIGFLLGAIVLVVFAVIFFVYAVPFIRGLSGSGGGIQVTLPKSVNVNVQQAK